MTARMLAVILLLAPISASADIRATVVSVYDGGKRQGWCE